MKTKTIKIKTDEEIADEAYDVHRDLIGKELELYVELHDALDEGPPSDPREASKRKAYIKRLQKKHAEVKAKLAPYERIEAETRAQMALCASVRPKHWKN